MPDFTNLYKAMLLFVSDDRNIELMEKAFNTKIGGKTQKR